MKHQTIEEVVEAFTSLKAKEPLIHVIPNSVTASFCADALSSLGARSVMAVSPSEVAEITAHSDCVVLNLGQPTEEKLFALKYSLTAATKYHKSIVFDPVGAGASSYRRDAIKDIMSIPWKGIIKGNMSEIQSILTKELQYNGVDDAHSLTDNHTIEDKHPLDFSHNLMNLTQLMKAEGLPSTQEYNLPTPYTGKSKITIDKTLAITGASDFVISKEYMASLNHKNNLTYKLVGAGCVAGCLCGAYAAFTDDFSAAVAGLSTLSLASRIAYTRANGYGDYKVHVLNALGEITSPMLKDYLSEILIIQEEPQS